MKKIYEKSELRFAIIWIVIYCVLQSLANSINEAIGVEYSASAVLCVIQAVIAHSAINTLSTFVNEAALTAERQIIYTIVTTVLAVAYTLILTKTLSQNQSQH